MKKYLYHIVAVLLMGFASTGLAEESAWDRAVGDPAAAHLPRPNAVQYAWHEQERLLFVCLDPCSWQGREYDNHSTKLTDMKLPKLDVEQWMAAAKAWGAKEVMLVCKHTGGFCWWPTDTTDYCVKNIPWKNGKGNLVQEVADACRKHGMSVGVYIYSDDPKYTGGIGRGGRTDNPAKQQEWNAKLRQQWKEVLGIYGKDMVREIWFDGSCIVPLKDIIDKMAPNAVIMNSKWANIRWVGNEEAYATDPNWNTINRKDLEGGVSTEAQSTPDGDSWAPVECDTTVYDHNWFWSPGGEGRRKSLDNLLSRYVYSIGRGSIFLLNSNPNTDGLIPEGDLKLYRELSQVIDDNFGHPVGKIEKSSGNEVIFPLGAAQAVNCVDISEDYRYGQRIRHYLVQAWINNHWRQVAEGTAVGRRKIDLFPEVTTDKIRVQVTDHVGTPLFRQILAHKVSPALVASLGQIPSLLKGAIATASSVFSAPYDVKYLIDGNPQTRWGSADKDFLAWVEFDLHRPRRFAGMKASELANRVREFQLEVRNSPDQPWRQIFTGGPIGNNYSTDLPATTARFVRFHVTKNDSGHGPTMWELSLQDRPEACEVAGVRTLKANAESQFDIDLSAQVTDPGQYEIHIEGAPPTAAQPLFEGQPGEDHFLEKINASTYRLNRTQAVAAGSSTGIRFTVKTASDSNIKILIRPL